MANEHKSDLNTVEDNAHTSNLAHITTNNEKLSVQQQEQLNAISSLQAPPLSSNFDAKLTAKLKKPVSISPKLAIAASIILLVPLLLIATFNSELPTKAKLNTASTLQQSQTFEQDQFASFHYWTNINESSNCDISDSSTQCQTYSVQTLYEITNTSPL